jgi:hypothetical protein
MPFGAAMNLWQKLFGPDAPIPYVEFQKWRIYYKCRNGHYLDGGFKPLSEAPVLCDKCGCPHLASLTARLVVRAPDSQSNWLNRTYSYEEFGRCEHGPLQKESKG